jgi:acetyl esterase/lipase
MLYEAADGSELPMLLFEPAADTEPAAGIILFHGGGLHAGSADSLAPHCRRLAARDIFAVSAGYRLLGQGAASIDDCVADVRRAVEHFRGLAVQRGLTASRQAFGGSSAGGHLALIAAMTAPDGPVPAREPGAAAVVALNPAGLDLRAFSPEHQRALEEKVGLGAGKIIEYSCVEYVRPGNPPTLIQHGTHDAVEPIDNVRRFRDAMVQAGNDCLVREYEGASHGFHYPDANGHFAEVVDSAAAFLLDRLASG